MACQWKQRPGIGDWALERQRQPRLQRESWKLRSTFVPFMSQPQLLALHTRSILPASTCLHNPRTADFTLLARAESWLVPDHSFNPGSQSRLCLLMTNCVLGTNLVLAAAHVSLRGRVSLHFIPLPYVLPSRMWIADFSVIFDLQRRRHH